MIQARSHQLWACGSVGDMSGDGGVEEEENEKAVGTDSEAFQCGWIYIFFFICNKKASNDYMQGRLDILEKEACKNNSLNQGSITY